MNLDLALSKVKEQAACHAMAFRAARISGVCTAVMMNPMVSFAAEDVSGGSNLLTGEVMTAITNGFSSLVVTATAVVAIAATTGVSIIGLSAAVKYAMKKIKGTLSSAA